MLEEPDVRDVLQGLFDIRRQANADTVAPYIAALSAVRLGLSPPAVVEESMPDAPGLADGFDRYRSALADLGAVDFDEQIYRALEILLTDADARAAAQARCRRLLVDEFQDLTPAHLLMIRLLSAPGYDCFGVGDDDQVIYGYSGATPEFLIGFPDYFPGAAHHPLEVNYRCPPSVVGAARHVLSYNHRRIDKTIRSPEGRARPRTGGLGSAGRLPVRWSSGPGPATRWPLWSSRWSGAGRARASSPTTSPCWPGSTRPSCPSRWRGGSGRALLHAARGQGAGPHRYPHRLRLPPDRLRSRPHPPGGHPGHHPPAVAGHRPDGGGHADQKPLHLGHRHPPAGRSPLGPGRARSCWPTPTTSTPWLRATGVSTAAALRAIGAGIGLATTMDVLDSSRREADRSTHADDLVALEAVAALHPEAATFEPWLRGVLARPPAEGPNVLLSTVHRIKGKEWGHVIVFGASEGLFPHRLSDDEEGERRVFHVALTRARSQVVVLADAGAPSPFVGELDGSRPHRALTERAGGPPRREPTSSARGRTAPRTGDRGPAAEPTAEAAAAERSLRDWRSSVARKEAVPAYVVLTDKDLIGIATELPRTLVELARCRGIGPLRLERWGDEILAVLGTGA